MSEQHGPQKVYPKSYGEAKNSDYLTAEDLQGQKVTVRLIDLDKKDLEGEDGKVKRRFIYTMEGKSKQWVSNTTNNLCLAAMFGPDPVAALGKRITLVSEPCKVEGKQTTGIRVWGSPELAADKTIRIKLPRRRAEDRVLHAVKVGAQTPPPAAAPGPAPAGPSTVDHRAWFLHACDSLHYDADTARGWAEQCGCPWDAAWTPDQVQALRQALVNAGWKEQA